MSNVPNSHKIQSIQYLRGVAALGVVLCHYGFLLTQYPVVAAALNFGKWGVYLFFLISGFIIVYSLVTSGYKTQDFFTFLVKRSIRIDPSYYVVILLTIVLFKLMSMVPSFKGTAIPFIPGQFISHLFYVTPFTKYRFYNTIFWTLSVEFQFYVLIGLCYFSFDNKWFKTIFLIIFSLSSLAPWPNARFLVFNYAPMFATGISLIALYQKQKWVNAILPTLFLSLVAYKFGMGICLLLIVGSIIILYYKAAIKPLKFLGNISYSLYLTHGLTLIVFLGIIKRVGIDVNKNQLWWLLPELILAVAAAYGFYWLIEKPSIKLSKDFTYKTLN